LSVSLVLGYQMIIQNWVKVIFWYYLGKSVIFLNEIIPYSMHSGQIYIELYLNCEIQKEF